MRLLLRKNFWVMLWSDAALLCICYYCAYLVRFEGFLEPSDLGLFAKTLPPLLIFKIACFFLSDLYRGMWRYMGITDLLNIVKGSFLGSLIFTLYLAMVYHFEGISRSVLFIDFVFTVVSVGGMRLLIRLFYQQDPDFFNEIIFWRKKAHESKKAMIIGTGTLAERLYRELHTDQPALYRVVGFIDEASGHRGMKIHGVPVLGSLEELPNLINYYRIDDVLVANPESISGRMKTLVELCTDNGIRVKIIPSLSERVKGAVAQNLRDIRIEDLLEREPVNLDMNQVTRDLHGKRVLITGAGGSIGSELARQISQFQPKKLVLLDNAETPLYSIEMELRDSYKDMDIIPCIGDIRNKKSLDQILKRYEPQIIFHAAAYKHVPMMELVPLDAVNTNVLGTFNLASSACKYHAEKFIMTSTDKAVRPTSVMGATKRVAEMVVQSMNGNGTRFVIVRFGNVLGSNGSVVPLFERQIAEGGPVTVTHPEVNRYFMTIPEAVMLVLQASAIGKGGELFLLDMGKPIRIIDLAKNMIKLAGLVLDRDIKIEYIGLRAGEKLYEELLISGEGVIDTAYNKIKVCNHSNCVEEKNLYEALERMKLLVETSYDHEAALRIIRSLIPAYGDLHGQKEYHVSQSPLYQGDKAVVTYDA
jgi:FlaA1/EpsC-like NDP-sugar epimerase